MSKSHAKHIERKLPKQAPKRTGKRGITAVDEPEKPKQARLPTMEDARIERLENAADTYAEVRDERMAWTAKEVEAKETLLRVMHDEGKTKYVHGKYEVEIKPEGEKLRVRVKKDEE